VKRGPEYSPVTTNRRANPLSGIDLRPTKPIKVENLWRRMMGRERPTDGDGDGEVPYHVLPIWEVNERSSYGGLGENYFYT
jgi:hypothetical protein